MTFTTWLKKEEGFSSKDQYDSLLNTLPPNGRRKVHHYYEEKYKYYLNSKPRQLEFEIK
ncbi:hypothetical protein B0P06_004287 [Clostridium saccharoperbutylacetonicum]|uniref:hypothetical protein n=1 Tax=Clostridium saccharoperbutylacetonicum TaxID=36745 RepID=UPI000344D5CA|nr:hypothetical protein [Clostridium saccharoperbutylacetonicum]NRT61820.1 hypothetical protein [Clostridium saccharoperbutylacetonicum]NSB25146.1 hypothetical protein [Clostridium saccharoperbutylacetonicum]NSB44516.1 hypothetical protein [Clostridium saccharoperbutylacetonicum]